MGHQKEEKEEKKRVHITITQQEHDKLVAIKKATGISVSEQLRRHIDEYLKK
jgi:hypothetical protein